MAQRSIEFYTFYIWFCGLYLTKSKYYIGVTSRRTDKSSVDDKRLKYENTAKWFPMEIETKINKPITIGFPKVIKTKIG